MGRARWRSPERAGGSASALRDIRRGVPAAEFGDIVSGFAGIVSVDGAPADPHLLGRMAERLAFRGPDGTHITAKPGAGFCFTFFRTGPAPQCPSQPCSLDGRVWLLGDVRLDGRDDLRRKLEQRGDEFDGDVTDEELVLRAWRRWEKAS